MKWTSYPIVVVLALLVAHSALAAGADKPAAGGAANPVLARIRSFHELGEKKLVDGKFTRKVVALTAQDATSDLRQKWEKLDAYYEGPVLVRIQLYPHAATSERTEEFYVMENHLVYAFIQDKGPKHEGRDMGEPGKEIYFDHDRLIAFEDRSGEPSINLAAEKRMYEASLPYEVSQVLAILAKQK